MVTRRTNGSLIKWALLIERERAFFMGALFLNIELLTIYICKYVNKYISLRYNKGGFMRTANYTDLRANLKSYIDAVIDDYDTVVINRGNGKGVVMISLDEYNSLKETEYIMSSPETMETIHKGEEDIKNGNSISQKEGESMDDFLKRAACTE